MELFVTFVIELLMVLLQFFKFVPLKKCNYSQNWILLAVGLELNTLVSL